MLTAQLDCDPGRTLEHTYLHQTHYQHTSRDRRTRGKSPLCTDSAGGALGTYHPLTTPLCVTDFLFPVIARLRRVAAEVAHSSRARGDFTDSQLQETDYKINEHYRINALTLGSISP